MPFYDFETTLKFKSSGDMDKAEDWIRANVKGLWAVEFIGLQEEMDIGTGQKSQVTHVRFKFGRKEDFDRFRNEYVQGKPPAAAAPRPGAAKPKGKPKPKGLLGWLLR